MIAVDTSALMAIMLDEAAAPRCMAAIGSEVEILISAGTLAETLIVAGRLNLGDEMGQFLDRFGFRVIAVTPAAARRIAAAYGRWGNWVHPAGLNLGDCFAYEVAKEHDCRLLYVGNDFAKTDIAAVL